MLKYFVVGYCAGIVSSLLCVLGCYIYKRTVRRTVSDNGPTSGIERAQSDTCEQLSRNERTAQELIQNAKNVLAAGKHIDNN